MVQKNKIKAAIGEKRIHAADVNTEKRGHIQEALDVVLYTEREGQYEL